MVREHSGSKAVAALCLVVGIAGCAPDPGPVHEPVAEGRIVQPPAPAAIRIDPLPALPAVNAAPQATQAFAPSVSVDARLLVITATGTSASLDAIRATLDYLGTPYDVLNATSDPPLTDATLGVAGHGRYQGIVLDAGGLETASGSAFSDAEWASLTNYEAGFGVRRLSLYTAPSAAYGLSPAGPGFDPGAKPIAVRCTPAGAAVFIGANCANPVTIDRGFAYPGLPMDASTTPLLVDGAGNVYGATRTAADGRETLALTFGQAANAVFSLELAYGLASWVTGGLFIGERHVYVSPQVDDLFLASTIYTGGTYRITDADLQTFADWQQGRRSKPGTSKLRVAFAANGAGSASRANDPLTAKAVALGATFIWINHSWDHPVLDSLPYASVFSEFMQNDAYLRSIGLKPYTTVNAVTPNVSGLGSVNAMQALFDFGIRAIVSDSSVAGQNNPSPNAGLPNPIVPGVLEIPRRPTELYFNVSQPAEWVPEYAVLRTAGLDYAGIVDAESSSLLLHLLRGENDPWMFHQANLRDYGGGRSLLGDLLDATFDKYAAVATFPVVSPQMEDLAELVTDRMNFNASGVSATIQSGSQITVSVTKAATIPVTGLCSAGAESYAGQPISYLKLAAGQSTTLPLGIGCPTSGTMTGPGDTTGAGTGSIGASVAGMPGAGTGGASGETTSGGADPPGIGCACGMVAGPAAGAGLRLVALVALAALARARRRRR
jgi:peptidoglycan/xylan/chitin deacetylase (PgdA/CDA1 family)